MLCYSNLDSLDLDDFKLIWLQQSTFPVPVQDDWFISKWSVVTAQNSLKFLFLSKDITVC